MTGQCDTAALGGVPGCAALPARGIGLTVAACNCEFGHHAHSFRVVADRVAILAEQADTHLADQWQIARPPVLGVPIVSPEYSIRATINKMKFVKLCAVCILLNAVCILLNAVCILLDMALIAAETPSPALLVLNKADQAPAIVDPASGKVAARVRVGEGPHEVTVSTDGKLAFVGNYGQHTPGNTISVIDLVGQKELRRVDLGPLCPGTACSSPRAGSTSRRRVQHRFRQCLGDRAGFWSGGLERNGDSGGHGTRGDRLVTRRQGNLERKRRRVDYRRQQEESTSDAERRLQAH